MYTMIFFQAEQKNALKRPEKPVTYHALMLKALYRSHFSTEREGMLNDFYDACLYELGRTKSLSLVHSGLWLPG